MSIPRFDTWIRSAVGPAAAGASVFICSQPATVSSNPTPQVQLYSDNAGAVPIAQPMIADGFGHVFCYVASGTYTVVVVYGGQLVLSYPDQSIGVGGLTLPLTFTPVANKYLVGYNGTTGTFTAQQPPFSDIAGVAVPSQLPVMQGDAGTGGVQGAAPAPAAGDTAAQKFLKADGTWQVPAGSGIGISSVGLTTDSSFFTISNSPLVANGTITMNLTAGLAHNKVLATPDGVDGVVGLRFLLASDIPSLPASLIASGVLALARGGNFFNALGDLIYGGVAAAPTVLSGSTAATRKFLGQQGNGSISAAPAWASIALADLPSITNAALANSQVTVNGDGVVLNGTGPTIALGSSGALALLTHVKNTFLAGPTSGADAAPTFRTIGNADLPAKTVTINYVIDGGGSSPTNKAYGQITIPVAMTITSVVVTSDVSGSCVMDLKTCTNGTFPGSLTSIVASAHPTLASQQISTDATLTGWTTSLAANSQLQFLLTSSTTVTRINITLICSVPAA